MPAPRLPRSRTRAAALAGGIAILAAAGIVLIVRRAPDAAPAATAGSPASAAPRPPEPPADGDTGEVFRRAFWRHPGTGDRILRAETKTWTDADGGERHAWAIAVIPGPELAAHLAGDPFGMIPGEADLPASTPAWARDLATRSLSATRAPNGPRRHLTLADGTLLVLDEGAAPR